MATTRSILPANHAAEAISRYFAIPFECWEVTVLIMKVVDIIRREVKKVRRRRLIIVFLVKSGRFMFDALRRATETHCGATW